MQSVSSQSKSSGESNDTQSQESGTYATGATDLRTQESGQTGNDGTETVPAEILEFQSTVEGDLTAITSASVVLIFALFYCMGFLLGQSIMERLKL